MDQLATLEMDLKALLQRRQHLQQTLVEIETDIQEYENDFIQNSSLLVDKKRKDSFRLFARKRRRRTTYE